MLNYKIFEMINQILNFFEDEESKKVFLQRVLFRLSNNLDYIYEIPSYSKAFVLEESYQNYLEFSKNYSIYPHMDVLSFLIKNAYKDKEIVIFGAGVQGYNLYRFLVSRKITISGICDNNKQNDRFNEFQIMNPESILDNKRNKLILISSIVYREEIYHQLIKMGLDKNQIFFPGENAIISLYGTPYFEEEFFELKENEVFIDAGAYRMETTIAFKKWCPDYKKVYSFEPDYLNYEKCKLKIEKEQIERVDLFNIGLWSEKKTLHFKRGGDDGTGSLINDDGEETIEVNSIDNILKGDEVTFIKMDIEGAELEALKGAKDTIRRFTPKLAICLYHKPDDIFEIPIYIKELVPEYKMGIRHYSTYLYDTVLYCWI